MEPSLPHGLRNDQVKAEAGRNLAQFIVEWGIQCPVERNFRVTLN